ncbi:unnamed protein product [Pleuronectes platessa]|uniref:Uncharacterized protein n=1 Tax=Pleuronectes platessa TaxID=8262 RepID=A0A9N7U7G3_PLEPL|nr:unnamed protein product [Pleuronectes platessa]
MNPPQWHALTCCLTHPLPPGLRPIMPLYAYRLHPRQATVQPSSCMGHLQSQRDQSLGNASVTATSRATVKAITSQIRLEAWQVVACEGMWRPQEEETERTTPAAHITADQYFDKWKEEEEEEA